MAEPKEKYTVFVPHTDDPRQALTDVVRQLNDILLRIAQEIANKADA